MDHLASFFIGVFIGLTTVGADMLRAIDILDGKVSRSVALSAVISTTYFFGITFIAEKNVAGYVGFSAGAAFVSGYLAWKKRGPEKKGVRRIPLRRRGDHEHHLRHPQGRSDPRRPDLGMEPSQGVLHPHRGHPEDPVRIDLHEVAEAHTAGERVGLTNLVDVDLLQRARDEGWIEHKQVILFRKDLKVRGGKFAAQCAHASMKVFLDRATRGRRESPVPYTFMEIPLDGPMDRWIFGGRFAKIVLYVADEATLLEAHRLAQEADLPSALITDAGFTEFHGVPTNTCIAIGPAPSHIIDRITGPEGAVKTQLA